MSLFYDLNIKIKSKYTNSNKDVLIINQHIRHSTHSTLNTFDNKFDRLVNTFDT